MILEKFITLEAPEKYDFSNDGASYEYQEIDNLKNVYEKFFAYMAVKRHFPAGNKAIKKFFECEIEYSKKCKEVYKSVPDPDSGSKLLQEIYSVLWNLDAPIFYCCQIQGETMNSVNTTLEVLYKLIETPEQEKERKAIKTEKEGSLGISIRYILSRYAEDVQGHTQQFDKIQGMGDFISIYHTLGNFIPVPVGCNSPRGMGRRKEDLHDYWDLTLKIIYDYYVKKEDNNISKIVGKSDQKRGVYKNWLDSFGSGKEGWKNFVEKNYLQDFVDKAEGGSYGRPIELWDGHFEGDVLPITKEEEEIFKKDREQFKKDKEPLVLGRIEQFYERASARIVARSIKMIEALEEKLGETEQRQL